MQLGRVGRQHPQVAVEVARLARVLAPAQLQVPLDQVRIAELAGEVAGVLVQDSGLLAAGGSAEHPRPLDGGQVVERDQRHQGGLALAAWQAGSRHSRSGPLTARQIRR